MSKPQPLTLEQMRADVAEMLGEAPAEIGDNDNLMDWGLDSMRMLNLVLKWRETGVALDMSHLAEHVTLGEWWRILQTLPQQQAAH